MCNDILSFKSLFNIGVFIVISDINLCFDGRFWFYFENKKVNSELFFGNFLSVWIVIFKNGII